MFDFLNNSVMENRAKNKKTVRRLLDKYGTLDNFMQNSTMTEDLEYKLAQGDSIVDEVERERQAMNSLPKQQGSSLDDNDMMRNARVQRARHEMLTGDISTTPTQENALRIESIKTALSHLGYYSGKFDSSITPGFYKALNDYSDDEHLTNESDNNRLLQAYEKLSKIPNPSRVDFDGEYLRFIENGNTILELPAMSGNSDFQEKKYQNLQDKGPLPEGNYRIKLNNVQKINMIQGIGGILSSITDKGIAPGGYPSWGKQRVWLEPFSSNLMYGRDKFSIHGGASLGSSGCIDIAGRTDEFFDKFKKYGRDMIVNVHYPKEKLR